MTFLRMLAFGFGYMAGGTVGAVGAGVVGSALLGDLADPPRAAFVAVLVAIMAAGLTGGALCLGLVNRLTRRDPVHPDYDDRPTADR